MSSGRTEPGLLAFVETQTFTRRVIELGLEEGVQRLQTTLLEKPDFGDLDPGTGGLRKARITDPNRGKGKRGGARVHYLWLPHVQRIYLIYLYSKGEAESLTMDGKRSLAMVALAIKAALGGSDQ